MMVQGAVLTRCDNETPFARHRPLAVRELQLDAPGLGEMLVKVEAAGLCHSDLSRVNGDRVGVVPVVLGHEGCGRVVALGEGVTDVAIGDKVSFTFHTRCGECSSCTSKRWSLCPAGLSTSASGEMIRGGRRLHWRDEEVNHHVGISAFADHAVVDRRSVVVIPEKVYLRGDLPVDKLISDYIRLDDLNEARDALTAGSAARQVVTFDT